ncbi:MAG: BatA domain-containing protein [Opitutales bacterium]
MNFLNSPILWGGLAAFGVAVPIIIHLLHQRHRRRTDWAAMELLRRALVIRSGQVRLEDILLLLLRCLVLALVAFALLRPTLDDKAGSFLGEQRVGMVVAIDASYSMAHGLGDTRMDEAKERAREILSTAKEGNPITIVLLGDEPRFLMRGANYDQERCARVLEKEEAKAYPERLNMERSVAELAELVAELKASVRECYLVTDAQAIDWNNLSENAKAGFDKISEQANLFIVPVETEGQENLAVTKFGYVSGSLGPAGSARFRAEVKNFGLHSHEGGTITLMVNDRNGTPKSLGSIEAGETKIIDFYATLDQVGDANLSASLGRDSLTEDNRRHTVVEVRDNIRILCVDGEPRSSEGPGEIFWLVKALELNTALDVKIFEWEELAPEDFKDYDLVVLANVANIGKEAAVELNSFVKMGGGLVVFAGERVDAESYNKRLHDAKVNLLPGELLKATSFDEKSADGGEGDNESSWTLGIIRSNHILAKLVAMIPDKGRSEARFQRTMEVLPDDNATTILSLSESNLPLALEKRVGLGAVLLFTTTADRAWSNLVVQPLFPMLMQQAVTHLTNRPSEPVALNIDPVEADVKVTETLEETLGASKATIISSSTSNLASVVKKSRKGMEISRTLLILALVLFILQGFLAKLFTSRMTSKGEADLQESLRKHTVIAARKT